MDEIVNRVAKSPLITFDLEEIYPEGDRVLYDIKDNLFQGMILREKDFREFIKSHDWTIYQDKFVAITCSVDAIVPTWSYMLLALQMEPYAAHVIQGDLEDLEKSLFQKVLSTVKSEDISR